MPEEKKKKTNKKKKKRNKTSASGTPPENTCYEKPKAASLHPETLPLFPLATQSPGRPQGLVPKFRDAGKKDERCFGTGRKSQKHPLTVTSKSGDAGDPAQGSVSVLSTEARESLRWEGVLEDPRAEERRLELYRAGRRQRYREAVLKESQDAMREKRTLSEFDKQEAESLQPVSTD